MKIILVAPALALAAMLAPVCALAQAIPFVTDTGFQAKLLFNLNTAVGGFDYDSAGNIFYLGGTEDTQLVKATKSSGYSTQSTVVDYDSFTYGSFVSVKGSEVYYGDSSNVNASSTDIISPTPGPNPIAAMPDNFDIAFSGGTTYVSANINGASGSPENAVYTLNTSTGDYHDILNTGDYSGPIAVTSSGELIYGWSGYPQGGGIYVFSAASVQEAITSGTAMSLSDATKVIKSAGNAAFALGPDNELFAASDTAVNMFNLTTGDVTHIGVLTNDGDYFAAMAYYDGALTIAETDGYFTSPTFTDFIDITAIPEPGFTSLAITGLLLVPALRRKRSP